MRIEPPRGLSEGSGLESHGLGPGTGGKVVVLLGCERWQVAERLQQPVVVESREPLQGREFDIRQAPPRASSGDQRGLVEDEHRLGQGVVVGVAAL
jgi:hypothetical protein